MKKKILFLASFIACWGIANAQDPIARWSFNDGTANNNNGSTAHGTVSNAQVAGSYDGSKSFDFNGNDAMISFGDNLNSVFTDSIFSISLWAKPRAAVDKEGNRSILMAKWVSTGEPNNTFILWVDGFDSHGTSANYDLNSMVFQAPQLNVWHHYVVQQNRDSLLVYIDNKLIATSKKFAYYSNAKELTLGALYTNSYNFDGKIDEVQVFDRCITRKEVDSLYKALPAVTTFNINNITVAKDSSAMVKCSIEPALDLKEFVDLKVIDPSIATIDEQGLVTGLKIGQTKLVFSSQNGTLVDTCIVRVINEKILVNITNGELKDKSGNELNATRIQASLAGNRFGQTDSAFKFTADGDALKIAYDSLLNPKHITLAAWYKPASFAGSGQDGIIEKSFTSNVAPYYQYQLWVCGNEYANNTYKGSFGFQMTTKDNKTVNINTAANTWKPGNWYFIVATYDGTQAKLFVNGQLQAQANCSGSLAAYQTDLFIGKRGNLDKSLRGTIDEASIYAKALSPKQIDSLFKWMPQISSFSVADMKLETDSSAKPAIKTNPLYKLNEFITLETKDASIASVSDEGLITAHKVGATNVIVSTLNNTFSDTILVSVPDTNFFAYYKFENNSASDRSFNGNDGTIVKAIPTESRFGQKDAALQFGTSDKSVKVKNIDLRGSQISFASWVYVNEFQTDVNHISSIVGLYNNGWCGLRIGDATWAENNRAQIVLGNANISQWVRLKSKTELQTKQYYHIAATYDGQTLKLYINGMLDTTATYNQEITTYGDLEIGSSFGERPLDGSIDEVSIYRRAITAHEVDSLYSIVPIEKLLFTDSIVSLPLDSTSTIRINSVSPYDLSKFTNIRVLDNSVVTYANGTLTAVSKGKTTVYIETFNNTLKDSLTVIVTKPATKIVLNKQTLSLQASGSEQLTVSTEPSDASNTQVEYRSSNVAIAQVSATGLVTSKAAGEVMIIATNKENPLLADTCVVTITALPTSSDELSDMILRLPNPANTELTVLNNDIILMQLISTEGVVVLQIANSNTLPLDKVSNGAYLLRLVTSNGSIVRQLIVQHQ